MSERQPWIGDHQELAATARMLYAANVLFTAEDVLDWLDAPWKWQSERDAWIVAGRPFPTDPGWDLLEARIDRMNR